MTLKENILELQDRMKYSGFGETKNSELEKQIKAGKADIEINLIKDLGDKKLEYDLHFRKSHEGRYYYNGFDARLSTPDGKERSQRFYQNQGITAKEAYNLLEGRAVFKSLFNKEGGRYNAWMQLDMGSLDEKGQHTVNQYHQHYGFDLEKAVDKLQLKDMEGPDQRDLLHYSLKKGNRHQVEIEGNVRKFQLEANPRFKTLNVYDGQGKRIKLGDLNVAQREVDLEVKKKSQRRSRSRKLKL